MFIGPFRHEFGLKTSPLGMDVLNIILLS